MKFIAQTSWLTPAAQAWLVAGAVVLTLAAFALRAWRKARMKGGSGHSCGCGPGSCERKTGEPPRR